MWADLLTKPLQGMVFKRMKAQLMNCSVEYQENEDTETPLHIKSLPERGKRFPSRHLRSVFRIIRNCEGRWTDKLESPGYKSVLGHHFRGEEESKTKEVRKMLTFY